MKRHLFCCKKRVRGYEKVLDVKDKNEGMFSSRTVMPFIFQIDEPMPFFLGKIKLKNEN